MRSTKAIQVVGAHAEGEVGRVIVGGVLPPPGATVMQQRDWLQSEGDALRRLLIREPRGGVFTHYNLIVPAKDPAADAGFIIMEPMDYPPMSGSNSICVATVLLETGMIPMVEPETVMTLETPGGLVTIRCDCQDGRVARVTTTNVPCFVEALEVAVPVEGLGEVTCDICYGGAFFALVDAASTGNGDIHLFCVIVVQGFVRRFGKYYECPHFPDLLGLKGQSLQAGRISRYHGRVGWS